MINIFLWSYIVVINQGCEFHGAKRQHINNHVEDHNTSFSLSDDPSLWPGHFKFLGSSQIIHSIDFQENYSRPVDFLNNYASPYIPVLFENSEQNSFPFQRWQNISYFTQLPQSLTHWISIPNEDRKISFRKYLSDYTDKGMVFKGEVPFFLRDDIAVPKCILCDPILALLSTHNLWITHHNHSSKIQRRNKDTIHCTYVGYQEFTLISHIEYGEKIPSDFESIDVKRVDFKKYPTLREVEYHKVKVKAGDCIYIPTKWYWQVNSYGKTYTVDIQWYHRAKAVKTMDCNTPKEVPRLNTVTFKDITDSNTHEYDAIFHYFTSYLIDKSKFTYLQFERTIRKDTKLMEDMVEWNEEYTEITKEVFDTLDVNSDKIFSLADLESLNQTLFEDIRDVLVDRIKDYEDILQDQQDELKEVKTAKTETSTPKTEVKVENDVENYLKNYIGNLQDVLRESIDELSVTGQLPDIKQRFAERQAKDSSKTDTKSKTTPPQTEREKAKTKLKLEREKKKLKLETDEKLRKEKEAEEIYTIVDDSVEEEILADDEEEVKNQPVKKVTTKIDPVSIISDKRTERDTKAKKDKIKAKEINTKKENKNSSKSPNKSKPQKTEL